MSFDDEIVRARASDQLRLAREKVVAAMLLVQLIPMEVDEAVSQMEAAIGSYNNEVYALRLIYLDLRLKAPDARSIPEWIRAADWERNEQYLLLMQLLDVQRRPDLDDWSDLWFRVRRSGSDRSESLRDGIFRPARTPSALTGRTIATVGGEELQRQVAQAMAARQYKKLCLTAQELRPLVRPRSTAAIAIGVGVTGIAIASVAIGLSALSFPLWLNAAIYFVGFLSIVSLVLGVWSHIERAESLRLIRQVVSAVNRIYLDFGVRAPDDLLSLLTDHQIALIASGDPRDAERIMDCIRSARSDAGSA